MTKLKNQPAIEPGQHWIVDLFRPEDAEGVVRLFLAVYGEKYPIRTYVEPARLKEQNAEGVTISSVARTETGDIVGHNALFRSAPHDHIYESGAGLVDTGYRGGKGFSPGWWPTARKWPHTNSESRPSMANPSATIPSARKCAMVSAGSPMPSRST